MKSNYYQCLFFSGLLCMLLYSSCGKTDKLPELSHQLKNSIAIFEDSKSTYGNDYWYYLTMTTKDTSIHEEKRLQYAQYPWKVGLNKQKVEDFLVYLQQHLGVERNYSKTSGAFPSISTNYDPLDANSVIADMMTCKLVKYNLTNSKGEKITIDETEVGQSKNVGNISISIAKWDLEHQKIKGELTLEITAPYTIDKVDLRPGDRGKTFKFGATTVDVLEMESNVLHYLVRNGKDYTTDILNDSCMLSSSTLTRPEYLYRKIRMKPGLTFKQFVADSVYFELNKPSMKGGERVKVIYFQSCDPGIIYLYGYRKSDVVTKYVTVPIDVEL